MFLGDEGAPVGRYLGDKDRVLIHFGSAGAAHVSRDRIRSELLHVEAARHGLINVRIPVLLDEVSALAVGAARIAGLSILLLILESG